MNTREEACAWLEARGVYARERDWVVGKSIMVAWELTEAPNGVSIFKGAVYLYPDDRNPGKWVLDYMYVPGPKFDTFDTLDEACARALVWAEDAPARREAARERMRANRERMRNR